MGAYSTLRIDRETGLKMWRILLEEREPTNEEIERLLADAFHDRLCNVAIDDHCDKEELRNDLVEDICRDIVAEGKAIW